MNRGIKRAIALTFAFAFAHLVITFALTVYTFAETSARFDDPTKVESQTEKVASSVATVLTLPGRLLWTARMSSSLPNIVEWAVFLANSILWGAVLSWVSARLLSEVRKRGAGRA